MTLLGTATALPGLDAAREGGRTPRPAADHIAASLHDLYRYLADCPDLRPGPRVDDLFGRLVDIVLTTPEEIASDVLAHSSMQALAPQLRDMCARGEYELEAEWARRVAASPYPHAELTWFPYLANYRQLSYLELRALTSAAVQPVRSVAFVGSGPLPLTSLFLTSDLGVPVDNIDRDPHAVAASRRLVAALGLHDLRVQHDDVTDVDLAGYDAVVLAALVGSTATDKAAVLLHLARSMRPGALLVVRSARGMRTLLYPEVDPQLLRGFEVLTVVHPGDEVINSVIVARARGDVCSVPEQHTGTG